MACSHGGFHRITSHYDRKVGMLIYVRVCERCGASLSEVRRMPYRPRFEPLGGDQSTAV